MVILRLTQLAPDNGVYPVELAVEGRGARRTATARVAPVMNGDDQARLRWYLEDYLERNADPAPQVAAGIERRMAAIGEALFSAIFEANRDTIRLWGEVCDDLSDVRLEISAGIREAHALPWELLRDPRTGASLALAAGEFVRVQSQVARAPRMPAVAEAAVRILVVICRPAGRDDVPFRSVALHIVKALTEAGKSAVDLDVLRPPTFAALGRTLRRAKEAGKPYHVVHFDGHGLYIDDQGLAEIDVQDAFDSRRLSAPGARSAARGYICFEDDAHPKKMQAIDGATLGNLLYDAGVPALVLNACRSGLGTADDGSGTDAGARATVAPLAQEDQVRAYGSFAQAVVDAGITGVVAMRYNVYVMTAARFVAEFYQSLVGGQTFGRAATLARKHLGDERTRVIAGKPVEMQDWPVPAVYEAAAIGIFPKRDIAEPLFDETDWVVQAAPASGLPQQPDIGFVGRDETLLALDRAFDRHSVVLLHAYAGSGKTTTAAEFARWYSATGGVDGLVLFSSFEQRLTLPELLDRVGEHLAPHLKAAGMPWAALDEVRRRSLVLTFLQKVPTFWIWDNVESVTGFPAGSPSAWSEDEQNALVAFLRDLTKTKAKVLVTSRRDEAGWLGDLPLRVQVPPMNGSDRRQLAVALIERRNGDIRLVEALTPLLGFSAGNPLTLIVVVSQALRDGIATREAAVAMAKRLRAGEAAFTDDADQGRSRSLGASLSYGFDHSFDDADRERLALLHFFQGFVSISILVRMEAEKRKLKDVPEGDLDALERTWSNLLERATDAGLLWMHGTRLFGVHPALPWFFGDLYRRAYPEADGGSDPSSPSMEEIYVKSILEFGSYVQRSSFEDQQLGRYVIASNESNILHARRIAEEKEWWRYYLELTEIMINFYVRTERQVEFVRLAKETYERFVDPATMQSRAGFEAYRLDAFKLCHARICTETTRPDEAERLLHAIKGIVEAKIGSDIENIVTDKMTVEQSDAAGSYLWAVRLYIGLIVEIKATADLKRAAELGTAAYRLALKINLQEEAGKLAANIGHCYVDAGNSKENIETGKYWYERAIALCSPNDKRSLSRYRYELAQLLYMSFQSIFKDIMTGKNVVNPSVVKEHFDRALKAAGDAADSMAGDSDGFLDLEARLNSLMGNILDDGGYCFGLRPLQEQAAIYYEKVIQISERCNDGLGAAGACREMARLRLKMGDFEAARIYASSSLARTESLGMGGSHAAVISRNLLAGINEIENASRADKS